MADAVDQILNQWREARPDIDPAPMELTGRLLRAAATVQERMEHTFQPAGLDRGWFDVLATLYRAGSESGVLTAGELAQWVMVSGGALTNRVDKLLKAGLVSREHDPNNRRRVLIALTEQGRAAVENIMDKHLDTCRSIAAKLSPEEVQQLNGLLRKMAQ